MGPGLAVAPVVREHAQSVEEAGPESKLKIAAVGESGNLQRVRRGHMLQTRGW